ncbi:trans-aconitate 2-methyltransferase [Nocardia sp. CS682]|uniref:trans-aconitate 2-methyltransferase n=1 Tax=Nocardia sp. CS682 TaxID=1047172 RepID=UPI001074BC0C|nr:trans-aconitate 2-methyltransferase [Nocardia sp. CS682]QBS43620.1 trans-aconitate 2-methyltransferase [Nocardia sp. CS682]
MWDPKKYLDFADHRARPFFELISRIDAEKPRRVVDLGCGPGTLTGVLAERWPDAQLDALDSSPEMVQEAQERGINARVLDIHDWAPDPETDVVVSNAVLQWVPDHLSLLAEWLPALPSGAWFAMQVPGNFDAPSHREIRALATEARWQARLAEIALRSADAVSTPADYATALATDDTVVDVWETTYLQRLSGPDPVLEWVTGTALRPIRAALDEEDWGEFRTELAARLRMAYPARSDGTTWFPFRRIFAVAHKPSS